MHMIQHMLLIVVAAPLLVVSGLPLAVLWTLPRSWSHDIVVGWRHMRPLPQLWRFVNRPLVAWTLFAGSLWLWHIPVLYDVALSSGPIHAVEHFLFLGTSALCWWILLKPSVKKLARYGVAVLFLFTTAVQSSILGALLAFSAYPWYPSYATSAAFTSLTPLEDQQLAGLIMWLPMGTVYMISAILFFGVWLNAMEHESQRPENPASTGRS